MEIWVALTLGAAFLQNIRSTLQKHLKSVMGTTGASFVRFGFGVPFAALFVVLLNQLGGMPVPSPNSSFLIWMVVGGLSQIAAQVMLVQMFSLRNFAVGNAYSRTEPIQAALFGLVFLGDTVSPAVLGAIGVSILGVMLISVARTQLTVQSLLTSVWSKTAGMGLASGLFFGLAAVSYRGASLALGYPGFLMQAATTLLYVIVFQTTIMLVWMLLRDRQELIRIAKAWKISLLVGAVGATASFGWFMAMTLQTAALVKALAQIEMLFSFASSVFIFREKILGREIIGCALIAVGIVALLVAS